MLSDKKYNMKGEFEKAKGRLVVCGSPGNVKKGIHYDEVFSSTPSSFTSRAMQALAIGHDLKRRALDVSQAYLWASREDNMLALRYPAGFKRWHKETGEELYMLCKTCIPQLPGGLTKDSA